MLKVNPAETMLSRAAFDVVNAFTEFNTAIEESEDEVTMKTLLDSMYAKNSIYVINLLAEFASNICETKNVSLDEALAMAKVPEDLRESVIERVEELN